MLFIVLFPIHSLKKAQSYDLGKMLPGNEPLGYIHIYSMLIRLTLSRDFYCWIVSTTRKSDKDKFTPLLWSKVFAEKVLEFLSVLNQYFFVSRNVTKRWEKLERSLRHLAKNRNSHKYLPCNSHSSCKSCI